MATRFYTWLSDPALVAMLIYINIQYTTVFSSFILYTLVTWWGQVRTVTSGPRIRCGPGPLIMRYFPIFSSPHHIHPVKATPFHQKKILTHQNKTHDTPYKRLRHCQTVEPSGEHVGEREMKRLLTHRESVRSLRIADGLSRCMTRTARIVTD